MATNPPDSASFVDVVIPVPIDKPYTYRVPPEFEGKLDFGYRVEVQFGPSKRYSALVVGLSNEAPDYRTKSVIDIIDSEPLIDRRQLKFWQWVASYYACSLGEVMGAALPANYKLSSETVIFKLDTAPEPPESLNDKAHLLLEALHGNATLSLEQVQNLLRIKAVLPLVHDLYRRGFIGVEEHLVEKYAPKMETYVRLSDKYASDQDSLHEALDLTKRSELQTKALLALLQLSRKEGRALRSEVQKKADVSASVVKALEKKGILEIYKEQVNRIQLSATDEPASFELSESQTTAYNSIGKQWDDHDVVLLHGATGSGKTWIYKKIINDNLEKGVQTLYLLPEIALTVQLVNRLQGIFGNQVVVSHSGLSNNERADLWKRVQEGAPIVLGVRSSIFLPFADLGTIIVDEEHDGSYKQADPAPRYQGRDAAIMLATQVGAKVLLGTATPAVESQFNADTGKYGIVKLRERYREAKSPVLRLVDLRKKRLAKDSQFSRDLIDAIGQTLDRREQVILFKNRRGYAPVVRCQVCGWQAMCDRCDIAMTYHKALHDLHCHLCGLKTKIPISCPACASTDIRLEGYGTQKLEDEIKVLFPEARVSRMDYDTTRRKEAFENIITGFEQQKIDILVGTQMVTKGLDFDHVGLVGVIHADQQLFFPHYRAVERTFQLLVQVSGRAGRKYAGGNVVVQTYHPTHPVFADVAFNDYDSFYRREIEQRRQWLYPPYVYLIKLNLKHKKQEVVRESAQLLAHRLRAELGDRILGPAEPGIARIRNQYLMDIGVKIERNPARASNVKAFIREQVDAMKREKGFSGVRVNIDVDPG